MLDEAMLDAAIDALRQRGEVDITVVSRGPHDTAARYGVRAIPPIGFAVDGPHARLRLVDATPTGAGVIITQYAREDGR